MKEETLTSLTARQRGNVATGCKCYAVVPGSASSIRLGEQHTQIGLLLKLSLIPSATRPHARTHFTRLSSAQFDIKQGIKDAGKKWNRQADRQTDRQTPNRCRYAHCYGRGRFNNRINFSAAEAK